LVVLGLWGTSRTVPYVGRFGSDAFRDAAVWGYGVFTLAVAACVVKRRALPDVVAHYAVWARRLVFFMPIGVIIGRFFGSLLPHMPGTETPILSTKAGDAAVHLAGAAAFMLAGFSGEDPRVRARGDRAFWICWILGFIIVGAQTRGGLVAITGALFVLATLDPVSSGRRFLFGTAIALIAAGLLFAYTANEAPRSQNAGADDRQISLRQVADNARSITGTAARARGNLDATKQWRLDWWNVIIDYTVHGQYFWKGKGFGINLADDDGFQVADGGPPLRSPHSVYMTVLARMGVPGALMFYVLMAWFAISMVLASFRARRVGAWWAARLDLWILSYWSAFLINAGFDVYLEGPQGGIWFWCVMGLGLAALETQRRELRPAAPEALRTKLRQHAI
jgi:hypothetical protein